MEKISYILKKPLHKNSRKKAWVFKSYYLSFCQHQNDLLIYTPS